MSKMGKFIILTMKLSEERFQLLEKKAELLKTLGHPIRLSIIGLLMNKDKMTVTDIFTALELEQAVVSHHLRLLKTCNALDLNKLGKHSHYYIADPSVKEIYSALSV